MYFNSALLYRQFVPIDPDVNILEVLVMDTSQVSKKTIENTFDDSVESAVESHWYDWILENLLNGFSVEDLIQKVKQINPYNQHAVIAAIESSSKHPLLQAAKSQESKLRRREWLLDSLDAIARLDHSYTQAPTAIPAPPFEYFIRDYYSKNKPVILKNGMDEWPAMKKWNPDYMKARFGEVRIEAQYGRDKDEYYEMNSPQHKKTMLMKDFVDLITTGGESNNYYLTGNNTKGNLEGLAELYNDAGDFAKGYRDMSINYRSNLFWFGPKGVFTPLHFDTFNIILAQVYGRKRVTLIPPVQSPQLYNDIHVYSKTNFPNVDYSVFPKTKNVTPIELILYPGEALFIPIGWWHCVEGLDISMSVSFTNFNAPNDFYFSFPRG